MSVAWHKEIWSTILPTPVPSKHHYPLGHIFPCTQFANKQSASNNDFMYFVVYLI